MTLKSFLEYLLLEKNYSVHTVAAYERDLLGFSEFIKEQELGELDEVVYAMVRDWIVFLSSKAVSNKTINRKMASLKAYYSFLQKTGNIEVNPLANHKSLKVPKAVTVPFSENEMALLLDADVVEHDFVSIRDRLIVELLYGTGIRRAELISLQIAGVDLESKTIKVLGKQNKERYLPLLEGSLCLFKKVSSVKENNSC